MGDWELVLEVVIEPDAVTVAEVEGVELAVRLAAAVDSAVDVTVMLCDGEADVETDVEALPETVPLTLAEDVSVVAGVSVTESVALADCVDDELMVTEGVALWEPERVTECE
jgi:hypothetical protein